MKKYPSIGQFRNVIKTVRTNHDYKGKDEQGSPIYEHTEKYPTLKFKGTVKAHGTNGAIVKYADGSIKYQSRERELSLLSDNAGFYLNISNINFDNLFNAFEFKDYIAIYGEWCGGNIQKGVALNQLPKMFIIFGLKIDDVWVHTDYQDNSNGIYNIEQFGNYDIDIDFENPELIQNTLIDMTTQVEEECPIGKYFGVSGIGEGIVFTCESNPDLKFKSKGEKHSSSKVKVLNSVDTEELENLKEFIDYAVTENRLQQGKKFFLENGIELHQKNTGVFISWIVKDILKEESDTILKNKINLKKVNSAIAVKAKTWFFNNI